MGSLVDPVGTKGDHPNRNGYVSRACKPVKAGTATCLPRRPITSARFKPNMFSILIFKLMTMVERTGNGSPELSPIHFSQGVGHRTAVAGQVEVERRGVRDGGRKVFHMSSPYGGENPAGQDSLPARGRSPPPRSTLPGRPVRGRINPSPSSRATARSRRGVRRHRGTRPRSSGSPRRPPAGLRRRADRRWPCR